MAQASKVLEDPRTCSKAEMGNLLFQTSGQFSVIVADHCYHTIGVYLGTIQRGLYVYMCTLPRYFGIRLSQNRYILLHVTFYPTHIPRIVSFLS
jgi:hypothetical protein